MGDEMQNRMPVLPRVPSQNKEPAPSKAERIDPKQLRDIFALIINELIRVIDGSKLNTLDITRAIQWLRNAITSMSTEAYDRAYAQDVYNRIAYLMQLVESLLPQESLQEVKSSLRRFAEALLDVEKQENEERLRQQIEAMAPKAQVAQIDPLANPLVPRLKYT